MFIDHFSSLQKLPDLSRSHQEAVDFISSFLLSPRALVSGLVELVNSVNDSNFSGGCLGADESRKVISDHVCTDFGAATVNSASR